MKSWHFGIIIAVLVGYALGLYFPAIGNKVRGTVGV